MKKAPFFLSALFCGVLLSLLLVVTLLLSGNRFLHVEVEGYGSLYVFGKVESGTVYYRDQTATYQGSDTLLFDDGSSYTGEIQNYLPNGKGVLTNAAGERCEATFVNGLAEGQGIYTFADGDQYIGSFQGGEMTGEGTLILSAGSTERSLTAVFTGGRLNGKQTYFYKNGTTYTGDYHDGIPSGEGTIAFPDGSVYEGTLVDGALTGNGRFVFADGSVYEGELEKGLAHGNGRYTYEENGIKRTLSGHFYKGFFLEEATEDTAS